MAVNTVAQDSKFKIQLDAGVDEKGKPIIKSKTFSNVKSTATNDDVYDVANSLAELQELSLISVRRIDEIEITQM